MSKLEKNFIIENASLVCPEGIIEGGTLAVENGVIAELRSGRLAGGKKRIDAQGKLVLPGFIDIHSDAIEKEIEPRPRSYFPFDIAILPSAETLINTTLPISTLTFSDSSPLGRLICITCGWFRVVVIIKNVNKSIITST